MKIIGAFKAMQIASATLFVAAIFAVSSLSSVSNAYANPARLTVIKKVEGLHETKNRKTIQAMVGINPATTPWCGAAAAYAVRKTGGTPPEGPNMAINWKNFGKKVSLKSAHKGDIVVLKFKRGHHVGIFSKNVGNGRIEVCGGNMSNRFKCSNYRTASIVAIRR